MIPPWTFKIMAQQGMPFKLALEKSWKDATVKERHFTTPLARCAKRGYTATTSSAAATPGDKGSKARARARARARRDSHGLLLTSRYAFATTPKEAARRRLSVTSSMCARYVLGIIQLQSVRRRMPRIPRARPTDWGRRSRPLRRYKLLLRKRRPCYTCLPVDNDRVI